MRSLANLYGTRSSLQCMHALQRITAFATPQSMNNKMCLASLFPPCPVDGSSSDCTQCPPLEEFIVVGHGSREALANIVLDGTVNRGIRYRAALTERTLRSGYLVANADSKCLHRQCQGSCYPPGALQRLAGS